MVRFEPGEHRPALGFREAVLSRFGFLAEFGFRPVDEKVTFVRYESPALFLNVYHGRGSYELNVELGKLGKPTERVYLCDIISWAGVGGLVDLHGQGWLQASSREAVQGGVATLAAIFKSFALPLLAPDGLAYAAALQVQSRNAHALMTKWRIEDAERAWRTGDYEGVAEALRPIRAELGPADAERLAAAERRLGPRAQSKKDP